jgi:hypothetical protein
MEALEVLEVAVVTASGAYVFRSRVQGLGLWSQVEGPTYRAECLEFFLERSTAVQARVQL